MRVGIKFIQLLSRDDILKSSNRVAEIFCSLTFESNPNDPSQLVKCGFLLISVWVGDEVRGEHDVIIVDIGDILDSILNLNGKERLVVEFRGAAVAKGVCGPLRLEKMRSCFNEFFGRRYIVAMIVRQIGWCPPI